MTREIKQLPKEIDKIIDSYFAFKKLIPIPLDNQLFHYLNIMGVYILYSAKAILYVGCSGNIGGRLKVHFSNWDYGHKIKAIDIIRFTPQDDSMGVEAQLIEKFKPTYNKINQYLRMNAKLPLDFLELTKEIKNKLGIK